MIARNIVLGLLLTSCSSSQVVGRRLGDPTLLPGEGKAVIAVEEKRRETSWTWLSYAAAGAAVGLGALVLGVASPRSYDSSAGAYRESTTSSLVAPGAIVFGVGATATIIGMSTSTPWSRAEESPWSQADATTRLTLDVESKNPGTALRRAEVAAQAGRGTFLLNPLLCGMKSDEPVALRFRIADQVDSDDRRRPLSPVEVGGLQGNCAGTIELKPVALPAISLTRGKAAANAVAVVIGVSRYRNEHIREALGAEDDARTMARVFKETMGLAPERVDDHLVGREAGLLDIREALDLAHNPRLKGFMRPDTTVYVYFSGHGTPWVDPKTKLPEPALLPWDGDLSGAHVLKVQELLGTTKHVGSVVAFVDACYSGTGPRSTGGENTRVVFGANVEASEGRAVFSASGGAETAQSIEAATKDGKSVPGGLFTYFLARGLSGEADADKNGSVTLRELEGFVRTAVVSEATKRQLQQTPVLAYGLERDATLVRLR